ncbi:hypothetical protein ADH76_00140 [Enterocloster clostridioformis]|uniref:DUF5597 domain-containing protein n=1 Tax=Enterocloster clostridioformis TaxID=1531 RepID=UPI0009C1C0DA|nr:DUF5597 domain-containing protein [Enterocloster clostridioformis]ANU50339.2 hypothetical protein A4V08_04240 [Lachnoclostridium sp. YL32]NDO27468.1 hypothetical protein [Enterocloster clostridioformis]OXE69932.1 hypothetical protein ADH76_00140 [Enterocloster clostridioformis]QQR00079.1 DUF5597 domain-containing protein [Enterocloster clostridioformis]
MYLIYRICMGIKILMVHGKPLILLGGEVHNSNSSSGEAMVPVWEKADELGMNALLLPVAWEQIEPEENVFQFDLVDTLLRQARQHEKKIVFLWFGSWKNAQCFYAPPWVKRDLSRFRRAQVVKGKNRVVLTGKHEMSYSTLSAFCAGTMEADAKAFAAFMSHLRLVDSEDNTVVAVQVENETGLMGQAREESEEADLKFFSPVPDRCIEYLISRRGELMPELAEVLPERILAGMTWSQLFGSMAEECFTAYYTASFVQHVAAAGKKEYPLPMLVNCWLDKGQKPGLYPTGGPVAKVMDLWHSAAPDIEIIAPDIYIPDFCGTCDRYTRQGNPLFIAECATHAYAAARAVYTVGYYHTVCYSPFGFEELGQPFSAFQGVLFGMDVEDEALKTPQDPAEYRKVNEILGELMPLLGKAYGTKYLQAACGEAESLRDSQEMEFDDFAFKPSFSHRFLNRRNGACLILQISPDTFYVLMDGCIITPCSLDKKNREAEYLLVEEGSLKNGVWKPIRRLNGDEVQVLMADEPVLLKIQFFALA